MKFIADENISRLVIERLRTAGFDVVAVRDLAPGISDRDVLKTATAEERIVLTEDRDFGELVSASTSKASFFWNWNGLPTTARRKWFWQPFLPTRPLSKASWSSWSPEECAFGHCGNDSKG
jgi:hypothetical protein